MKDTSWPNSRSWSPYRKNSDYTWIDHLYVISNGRVAWLISAACSSNIITNARSSDGFSNFDAVIATCFACFDISVPKTQLIMRRRKVRYSSGSTFSSILFSGYEIILNASATWKFSRTDLSLYWIANASFQAGGRELAQACLGIIWLSSYGDVVP